MAAEDHELRQWMRVQFEGEPGIDVGGLEREWFLLVIGQLFAPETKLFTLLPDGAGYTIDGDSSAYVWLLLLLLLLPCCGARRLTPPLSLVGTIPWPRSSTSSPGGCWASA